MRFGCQSANHPSAVSALYTHGFLFICLLVWCFFLGGAGGGRKRKAWNSPMLQAHCTARTCILVAQYALQLSSACHFMQPGLSHMPAAFQWALAGQEVRQGWANECGDWGGEVVAWGQEGCSISGAANILSAFSGFDPPGPLLYH